MADFTSLMGKHGDLPLDDQKKAGQAIGGKMDDKYEDFLKTLIGLLDRKEINTTDPQSFLKMEVYEKLPQDWKDKTDLALLNIAQQIKIIEGFFRSKETPNSSPHLQTMI